MIMEGPCFCWDMLIVVLGLELFKPSDSYVTPSNCAGVSKGQNDDQQTNKSSLLCVMIHCAV